MRAQGLIRRALAVVAALVVLAYPAVRTMAAGLALAAAIGWALDRLGVLANPLAVAEDFAIAHPQAVVLGLAATAATAWVCDGTGRRNRTSSRAYAR